MASQGNLHAEQAKTAPMIREFFAKSLNIILECRSPFVSSRNFSGEHTGSSPSSLSSSSSLRPRNKWFNLALRECPASLESLELNTLETLVVDVILVQRAANVEMGCSPGAMPKVGSSRNLSSKERFLNFLNTGEDDFPSELQRETVIERWTLQYANRKSNARDLHLGRMCSCSGQARHEDVRKMGGSPHSGKDRGSFGRERETGSGSSHSSHSCEGSTAHKAYKRSIILLRSLYVIMRLLPAYKIFQHLHSSNKIFSFSLNYKVLPFVDPLSRAEEAEMQLFTFVPVDTPCGKLSLSVLYRPTLSEVNLEASTPVSPQLIPDYVGSPTINPLKRFSSGPITPSGKKAVDAVFLPLAGERPPSFTPVARRHSWSNDLHRAAPYSNSPPFYPRSFSPLPSSDHHASPSNLSGHRLPPRGQPHLDHSSPVSSPLYLFDTPCLGDITLAHKKQACFDEYGTSPLFSPSLSPSPPTNLPGSYLSKDLLRSESAPVSIPFPRIGISSRVPAFNYDHSNILPPSSSPKCMLPHNLSPSDNFNPHLSQATPDNKLPMKPDSSRSGKCQIGLTSLQTYSVEKVSTYGDDDIGSFFGMKISSSSSPRISVSRSSLSLQDDFYDSDNSCPFALIDYDIPDLRNRSESFDGKGLLSETPNSGLIFPVRKSHDAAVGALVHLLSTAPPLRQDSSNCIKPSQVSRVEPWGERMRVNATPPDLQTPISDPGTTASGLLTAKTASDALEELRVFSEMKDLLLTQRGSYSLDIALVAKAVDRGSI